MSEILNIIGEDTDDYFHIQCADCGAPTQNVYGGWDPGVPFFTAECTKCGKKGRWKLDLTLWKGLPPQAHRNAVPEAR